MRGNRVAEGSGDVIVQCRSPDVQKTQRHTDTYICIEGVKKKDFGPSPSSWPSSQPPHSGAQRGRFWTSHQKTKVRDYLSFSPGKKTVLVLVQASGCGAPVSTFSVLVNQKGKKKENQ